MARRWSIILAKTVARNHANAGIGLQDTDILNHLQLIGYMSILAALKMFRIKQSLRLSAAYEYNGFCCQKAEQDWTDNKIMGYRHIFLKKGF